MTEENKVHKLVIVGSGPAGLTAGIYAARARFEPILLAGEIWGGQLMNTTDVENFPGFPDGISGPDLMMNMIKQAEKFGTKIIYKNADFVDLSGKIKIIKSGDVEYKAEAVIFATGSTPRKLEIPGEKEFWGRGVSSCATCDGAFFREKVVAVVGGGDSAMEEASFLTKFAKKVYLVHRKDSFRASTIMQERVQGNPKIELVLDTVLTKINGEKTVTGIDIQNLKTNENSKIELDGVFLAIGHIPVTGYLENKLSLDEKGYVVLEGGNDVVTNIPGVFVAGEIQDQEYKQAITTAGAGCKAALEAQRYLEGSIKTNW